jgi:hypothetical protein
MAAPHDDLLCLLIYRKRPRTIVCICSKLQLTTAYPHAPPHASFGAGAISLEKSKICSDDKGAAENFPEPPPARRVGSVMFHYKFASAA